MKTRSLILFTIGFFFVSTPALRAQLENTVSGTGYDPRSAFFAFNGRVMVFGEHSSRQASFTDMPHDYSYIAFSPSFAVYGVPFSIDLLYSTQDQVFRQNINSFNLSLNPSILQEYIISRAKKKADEYLKSNPASKEPVKDTMSADSDTVANTGQKADTLSGRDTLSTSGATHTGDSVSAKKDSVSMSTTDKLKKLQQTVRMEEVRDLSARELSQQKDLLTESGLLSSYEKFILLLPRVGIGTNYPQFTELTLSGIALNGVDIEWNPGSFYFAFSTGKVMNPIVQHPSFNPIGAIDSTVTTVINPPVFARTLSAARLGFGSKSDSYFVITGLYSTDDPNSIKFDNDTLAPLSTPQENMLLGLEANINMLDSRVIFNTEVNASLFTSDITSSEIQFSESSTSEIPQFVRDNVKVRLTSFWDWAALANLKVNIPESSTRFSAGIRRIGTGYRSLGLLNQRNDYIRYDIRADQGFLSRQLSIGGFVRHDRDNLIEWKRATTTIDAFGINVGVFPRRYPYLRVMYAPYYQRNNSPSDTFKVDNTTSLLNAMVGFGYQFFDLSHSTSIAYTTNSIRSFRQDNDFDLLSLSLGHSTSFEFPLTVSGSFGFISQKGSYDSLALSIYSYDLSIGYLLWEICNIGAGINVSDEAVNGTRTGFYFSLNVPIWKIATLDIRAEKNVFKSTTSDVSQQFLTPFDETIVRATLSKYW